MEKKMFSVWDGKYKGSVYYEKGTGRKRGSSVDRYSCWDGRYLGTDHYDEHNRKIGRTHEGPHHSR